MKYCRTALLVVALSVCLAFASAASEEEAADVQVVGGYGMAPPGSHHDDVAAKHIPNLKMPLVSSSGSPVTNAHGELSIPGIGSFGQMVNPLAKQRMDVPVLAETEATSQSEAQAQVEAQQKASVTDQILRSLLQAGAKVESTQKTKKKHRRHHKHHHHKKNHHHSRHHRRHYSDEGDEEEEGYESHMYRRHDDAPRFRETFTSDEDKKAAYAEWAKRYWKPSSAYEHYYSHARFQEKFYPNADKQKAGETEQKPKTEAEHAHAASKAEAKHVNYADPFNSMVETGAKAHGVYGSGWDISPPGGNNQHSMSPLSSLPGNGASAQQNGGEFAPGGRNPFYHGQASGDGRNMQNPFFQHAVQATPPSMQFRQTSNIAGQAPMAGQMPMGMAPQQQQQEQLQGQSQQQGMYNAPGQQQMMSHQPVAGGNMMFRQQFQQMPQQQQQQQQQFGAPVSAAGRNMPFYAPSSFPPPAPNQVPSAVQSVNRVYPHQASMVGATSSAVHPAAAQQMRFSQVNVATQQGHSGSFPFGFSFIEEEVTTPTSDQTHRQNLETVHSEVDRLGRMHLFTPGHKTPLLSEHMEAFPLL